MKLFRQLGFLMLPLRPGSKPHEEDQRVLNLFLNRAELKKAYGELQKEVYRLKDRIKQQEGATQRAQDVLAGLESQLSFAETGYPALVFYQLRRLWHTGRGLLEQLVADLSRRQDQRERQQHFAEHHEKQKVRLQAADSALREAEKHAVEAGMALHQLMEERDRLNQFLHYFQRRALLTPIAAAQSAHTAAESTRVQARTAVDAIQKEPVPEFPGLSLEARRAINLAAIAYAEALCLRLSGTPLVKMTREASTYREINAEEYGSRAQCEALMAEIDRAQVILQSRGNVAQEIKVRSERLRSLARYRTATDTAPTADSLVPSAGEAAENPGLPNVLAEDTWDLYKVLLR
jgi:hypothetical protein